MAEAKTSKKVSVTIPYDRQFTENETMLISAGEKQLVVKRGETVELDEAMANAVKMRIAFERRMIARKKKVKSVTTQST